MEDRLIPARNADQAIGLERLGWWIETVARRNDYNRLTVEQVLEAGRAFGLLERPQVRHSQAYLEAYLALIETERGPGGLTELERDELATGRTSPALAALRARRIRIQARMDAERRDGGDDGAV